MRKSTHLIGVPSSSSDSDTDYFNEFGEPVYVQTHLVHAKETQEETPHPVSNKCQLGESVEAGGRPLSYCSAEG